MPMSTISVERLNINVTLSAIQIRVKLALEQKEKILFRFLSLYKQRPEDSQGSLERASQFCHRGCLCTS